mmetsp:Transcript_15083/g.31079  ORF Transcript_15083/g.31079 Transcript_15083/m.31079 type:complete len:222 (-) Transcript_15083:1542-2207(-)
MRRFSSTGMRPPPPVGADPSRGRWSHNPSVATGRGGIGSSTSLSIPRSGLLGSYFVVRPNLAWNFASFFCVAFFALSSRAAVRKLLYFFLCSAFSASFCTENVSLFAETFARSEGLTLDSSHAEEAKRSTSSHGCALTHLFDAVLAFLSSAFSDLTKLNDGRKSPGCALGPPVSVFLAPLAGAVACPMHLMGYLARPPATVRFIKLFLSPICPGAYEITQD